MKEGAGAWGRLGPSFSWEQNSSRSVREEWTQQAKLLRRTPAAHVVRHLWQCHTRHMSAATVALMDKIKIPHAHAHTTRAHDMAHCARPLVHGYCVWSMMPLRESSSPEKSHACCKKEKTRIQRSTHMNHGVLLHSTPQCAFVWDNCLLPTCPAPPAA
jgi:hypothetical protein